MPLVLGQFCRRSAWSFLTMVRKLSVIGDSRPVGSVPSGVSGRISLTLVERRAMPRGGEDPKVQALRAERSLNPRPEAVSDERFSGSEFLDARDLVQVKYEMVRRARVDGEPVGRAAAGFGFSRPSFYAAERALDEGGLAALVPARPGPRGAHKLTRRGRHVRPRATCGRPGSVIGRVGRVDRGAVRGARAPPLGRARPRTRRALRKRG